MGGHFRNIESENFQFSSNKITATIDDRENKSGAVYFVGDKVGELGEGFFVGVTQGGKLGSRKSWLFGLIFFWQNPLPKIEPASQHMIP